MHDMTKNSNYDTTRWQHTVVDLARRGTCENSCKSSKSGEELDRITDVANIRHDLNEHGYQEEVGCRPETLPHIINFREVITGEDRVAPPTLTPRGRRPPPSFIRHPSPFHLYFAQRSCTQAPMFEPLLQALDMRNGRAHIMRAKRRQAKSTTLHGRKHERWLQIKACHSCLPHHSTTTSLSLSCPPQLPVSLSFPSLFTPSHTMTFYFFKLPACKKAKRLAEREANAVDKSLRNAIVMLRVLHYSACSISFNREEAKRKFRLSTKGRAFKRGNARATKRQFFQRCDW